MFVDERASDEQMEKLTAVFGGQKGGATASGSGTRSTSRSRTSSPSASKPVSRSGSSVYSIRPRRSSTPPRRSARRSAPSVSNTRARRGSRRRSSPGPPEPPSSELRQKAPDAALDLVADHPDRLQVLSRRVLDLPVLVALPRVDGAGVPTAHRDDHVRRLHRARGQGGRDRKSTRLNSSHMS